ncbi:MAG: enoyl-CoA hydratase/isomerase family protein [Candidatus Aminicenantes bacterium]|jgi:enoyl-CoA hydratase/carnithine racemase
MINLDYQDKVMVVKLNRGVINALNLELVHRLSEAFGKAKNDPDVHGLVLGSSNEKFFCIGFDIPGLYELNQEDFSRFYRAFNNMCLELYTLPKPTTAAITGHATAGGCILAICCDYRLIAEGKKLMGLNEIKLGVPVPYLADCILHSIVGVRYARDIIESGDFYRHEQSLKMGVVDQILPLEQVRSLAVEKVQLLGSINQQAYALIKRNRVETIEAKFLACREEKQEAFIQCWYSLQARQKLKEAIEKF